MVFSFNQNKALNSSLKKLFSMVLTTHQIQFTREEFYLLFVSEEDRYVLERAPEVGNDSSLRSSCTASWPELHVSINFILNRRTGDRYSPLAPRHPKLQVDAPLDLVDKLNQWLVRRIEIGTDFGRAAAVLEHLNTHCTTISQVRYAWPSVLALARMNEDTENLAKQIATFRQPRTIPPLNHEVRKALRTTSTTISSALLIGDDIPELPSEVTMSPTNLPAIEGPPLKFRMW